MLVNELLDDKNTFWPSRKGSKRVRIEVDPKNLKRGKRSYHEVAGHTKMSGAKQVGHTNPCHQHVTGKPNCRVAISPNTGYMLDHHPPVIGVIYMGSIHRDKIATAVWRGHSPEKHEVVNWVKFE
jgi:hypothetical protein